MTTMNLPPQSMDGHHFYMERSTPITFTPSSEQLYERSNAYSELTIPQYPQYYYLGTNFAEQQTTQSPNDQWEFQPDPQHEGRWVTALQAPGIYDQHQGMDWSYASHQSYTPGEIQYPVSIF